MHHLQDITGATYSYDPDSGAIFYGQAGADAFAFDDGTTYLSACGCPAETGCQCHLEITSLATPTKTPLSEIRAGVERVKREMRAEKAEREAAATRRRVANEVAAAYRAVSSRPIPEPYSLALAERGLVPEVWCSDGITPPLPYDLALAERGTVPEVWRSTGGDPPEPYTEALRRREES